MKAAYRQSRVLWGERAPIPEAEADPEGRELVHELVGAEWHVDATEVVGFVTACDAGHTANVGDDAAVATPHRDLKAVGP